MVRMTTGGVLKSYRYNLMNSFITDNKARETALTQRVFNSYAEAPAAAAKAFRLRKSRMMTNSQLSICQDTYYKFQAGFQSLQTVSELIDTTNNGSQLSTLKATTLEMLNDPTGDARTQLSKVLDQLSDSIIQNMNQTYGDDFIFAGADGYNVPFTVEEVDGVKQLYFRGVPVDAAAPNVLTGADGETPLELENGDYVLASATTVEVLTNTVTSAAGDTFYVQNDADPPISASDYNNTLTAEEQAEYTEMNDGNYYKTSQLVSEDTYDARIANAFKQADGTLETVQIDGKDYYVIDDDKATITQEEYNKEKQAADKLDYLMNEKRFVDIGLGFQEDEDGNLIESSAYNAAINGLTFLGCGLDADGDPKNIYSIVQRLTQIADSVPDSGKWDDETYDEFHRLVGKLETASSTFKNEFANLDAGTQKLYNNMNLLEDQVYSLKEQYAEIEDVNMADAITSFIWAEYCYNAALKVGNSILSQSLMDYLS